MISAAFSTVVLLAFVSVDAGTKHAGTDVETFSEEDFPPEPPKGPWDWPSLNMTEAPGASEMAAQRAAAVSGPKAIPPGLRKRLEAKGFKLHPKIEARKIPGMGVSYVVGDKIGETDVVADGTVLVESPIFYDVTKVPEIFRELASLNEKDVPEGCDMTCQRTTLMAFGLAYEVRKEQKTFSSFWGRYALDMYPQSLEDIDNIVGFDSEMLSVVVNTSAANRVEMYMSYMSYANDLIGNLGKLSSDPFAGNPITKDEVSRWYGTMRSRLFHLTKYAPILVAGVDCCINHNVDMDQAAWFESPDEDVDETVLLFPDKKDDSQRPEQVFRFRAGVNYNAGDQVYHFYNDLSSLDLLVDYGFIRPSHSPKIGALGGPKIPPLDWAGEEGNRSPEWREICSEEDEALETYDSREPSAFPEGYLICIRAAAYGKYKHALKAKKAGWLVRWDDPNRITDWSATKRISAAWVELDSMQYLEALHWCRTEWSNLEKTLKNYQKIINASDASGLSAKQARRRAMFLQAVSEEKDLYKKCSETLKERLEDMERLKKCCMKKLPGTEEETTTKKPRSHYDL